MIFYFTGTGNSKLVAEILEKELIDNIVSINDILKNKKKLEFYSEAPFVLVSPVYAWRLPKKIEAFLKKASFSGNKKIYIVATMGGSFGNADKYIENIIKEKNMEFLGFKALCMPNNYLVGSTIPTKEQSIEIIKKSIPVIKKIALYIKNNKPLPKNKNKITGKILSGPVNKGFNHFMLGSTSFSVSDNCIKCQKCINECPVNNISLKNGVIHFENKCMFCLGCINKCPSHAIKYKKKESKNGYYSCPSIEDILNK